jgi:DNA excision repair protein ERCC-2
VAEGVEFSAHYGRCILMYGIPFQNNLSREMKVKLNYLKTKGIEAKEYLKYDAIRYANKCTSKILRSKYDYGLVILADKRYKKKEYSDNLP